MPSETGRRDGVRADVGVGREAVGEAARRRAMPHPADDRVVRVEDRPAVRWQRLEQLALGRLDRLERADPGQVDRLDRGDHPDPRLGHPGQVGDLAADVHPHLEHGRLVLGAEPHERQRQADLVVEVALVAEGPEAGREHARDGLLGRRLGDAPGDADDERLEAAPPAGRDGPQRGKRVGDAHHGDVTERRRHRRSGG